jgi:hypothetical protein
MFIYPLYRIRNESLTSGYIEPANRECECLDGAAVSALQRAIAEVKQLWSAIN